MTCVPNVRADLINEPVPNAYRAVLLAEDGTIVGAVCYSALNDGLAVDRATSIADGHTVELWNGLRFIGRLPSVE